MQWHRNFFKGEILMNDTYAPEIIYEKQEGLETIILYKTPTSRRVLELDARFIRKNEDGSIIVNHRIQRSNYNTNAQYQLDEFF